MVRSFVETSLQRRGYSVLVCRNPNRAESVFRKAGMKVHPLIISLALPGGRSGHQLATELVKLRPALRVLYTSGF
ncbi:MAG: two-component hybrid sensor and regulator [Bryobacterales bacterium]|jgi:DNA-binding response OmpR family regulator|nr:two-component hybrid sensor and regulator [Bryobacterales bacterium]